MNHRSRWMAASLPILLMFLCTITSCTIGREKGAIHADTDDMNSPGVYMPKNLEECFLELEKMLPKETIDEMKNGTEQEMIRYHHGLGTWIRNEWGLWRDSELSKYFNKMGIFHPDDMSGIILKTFWCRLNDKPIRLEEHVEYYKSYWQQRGGT